ncbi:Alginate biosynthesis protein AlgA [bacterium HR36]|nr:Alginate biosynthesis protein AlgA [bacterium HR36]
MASGEVWSGVHVVIMAGGSGTRFWPRSRRSRPKQLLALVGDKSLLRQCAERFEGQVPEERLWTITTADLQQAVSHELMGLVLPERIIGEPTGRDTAPCLGLAAALIARREADAIMIAAPADHLIEPVAVFRRAMQAAVLLAREFPTGLVTLGVAPTWPATGYGYIRRGASLGERLGIPAFRVAEFREKPDHATAEQYCASGEFFWNSGLFVWRVEALLRELERQQPRISSAVCRIAEAWDSRQRQEVLRAEYAALPKISIDYAVMEGCATAVVLAAPFRWDDLGSWSALERLHPQDAQHNTILAQHVGLDTHRCLIVGAGKQLIATLGVQNLLIVATEDAILVARKDRENEIRHIVQLLEQSGGEAYL